MTDSDEERRLRDALASEAGEYVTVRRDDLAWAVGETWAHGEIERLRACVADLAGERGHADDCNISSEREATYPCDCGADEWNARVRAAKELLP